MSIDFNDAEAQHSGGSLIPDKTIAPVHMTVRPGGHGPEGWLKRSKNGDALMLDCEFTVTEGPYAKRKFWSLFTVEGETNGQKKACDISRSRIRAMLESARGIDPADASEDAINGRRVSSWSDLDSLRFVAVIGVEEGKNGYKDKNVLTAVVTPDRKEWAKLDQVKVNRTPAASVAKPAATSAGRPSWAA